MPRAICELAKYCHCHKKALCLQEGFGGEFFLCFIKKCLDFALFNYMSISKANNVVSIHAEAGFSKHLFTQDFKECNVGVLFRRSELLKEKIRMPTIHPCTEDTLYKCPLRLRPSRCDDVGV